MFSEILNNAERSRNRFVEQVTDQTGREMLEDVYEPFTGQVRHMQSSSAEAQEKAGNIRQLLMELRSII